MRAGERILGKGLLALAVRPTFYRQFVGGNIEQELRSVTNRVGYMYQQSEMGAGERIPGKGLFSLVARPTFYRQCVGGTAGAPVSHKLGWIYVSTISNAGGGEYSG
jgi:hypothetical protein